MEVLNIGHICRYNLDYREENKIETCKLLKAEIYILKAMHINICTLHIKLLFICVFNLDRKRI